MVIVIVYVVCAFFANYSPELSGRRMMYVPVIPVPPQRERIHNDCYFLAFPCGRKGCFSLRTLPAEEGEHIMAIPGIQNRRRPLVCAAFDLLRFMHFPPPARALPRERKCIARAMERYRMARKAMAPGNMAKPGYAAAQRSLHTLPQSQRK